MGQGRECQLALDPALRRGDNPARQPALCRPGQAVRRTPDEARLFHPASPDAACQAALSPVIALETGSPRLMVSISNPKAAPALLHQPVTPDRTDKLAPKRGSISMLKP